MKCKREGCESEIEQGHIGRPKVFCSAACRLAFWNASQRGEASPTHKISDYDATTRRGVCAICGPVTVYVSQDKYADGRPRQRLSCAKRVKSHAGVTNARYGRSMKRHAKRYGLSVDELTALVLGQLGRCAICERQLTSMIVDHDHETGAVRGLLCVTCNTGLGHLGDSVEHLERALEYLRSSR